MEIWKKLSFAGLGAAGTTLGLSLWLAERNWKSETRLMVESLKRSVSPWVSQSVSFEVLKQLPEPVARYFRFALTDGQPLVSNAEFSHRGEFYLGGKWVPFTSQEFFCADPPAYVWDARMKMNSLRSVRVRYSYSSGQGSMVAKALALYTVTEGDSRDRRLAEGALMRYLAEAVWLPTALLPGERLVWSPIHETRSLATLTDLGLSVSLEFTFGEQGEIVGAFSPARYREANGEYELVPWAGRYSNYQKHGGMMVPEQAEVEWQGPEANQPYWKGTLTAARYDFVKG